VLIAIIAILVIGGGATGIVLATTGKKHHQAGPACSIPASSSPPASGGTSGAEGGAPPPSESQARAVAECYLADINKKDTGHAETLVCSGAKAAWKKTVNEPNGDFTVHVDKAEFSKSAAGSDRHSTEVTYKLDLSKGGKHQSTSLTFTVIDENGPKICDES
jgi:hypothetical protein